MNTASMITSGGTYVANEGTNDLKDAVDVDSALRELGSPLSIATEIVATTEVSENDAGASYTDLPGHRSYDAGDYWTSLDEAVDGDRYSDVNGDSTSSMTTPTTRCKVPNDSPPVLMCALFDHLHSHSIMHIVQRLLLPSPTRRQATVASQKSEDAKHDNHNNGHSTGANDNTTNEYAHGENNPSEINNRFINTLSAMNTEEDEEDDVDPANNIFQCDWSMLKTDQVLELLLKRLGGDISSFLVSYGHPVGYDSPCCAHVNGKRVKTGTTTATETYDRQLEKNEQSHLSANDSALLCSQHASEILIAIIQNSPLDSPFMISLSSGPSLQKIIDLIMPTSSSLGVKEPEFVAHESIMTCAITVLECLVLQLGGYGAVAASSSGADVVGNDNGKMVSSDNKTGPRMTDYDLELHSLPSPGSTHPSTPVSTPDIANASTLLLHVNALLSRLSGLLTHPTTQTWVELAQYSNGRPRTMLGASRLCIVRLVESLVLLGNSAVDIALQSSDCLEKCLDLFWQFEWCSMLHQSAANILVHVFEGGVSRMGLQEYFLRRCNLLRRLIDSFVDVVGGNTTSPIAVAHTNGPLKEEREALDQLIEDNTINLPRLLQHGEATVAVSKLSTIKGEHYGSQDYGAIGEDEVDSIAPVSEDDVDSVMEKECQEGIIEALMDLTPKDGDEVGEANKPPDYSLSTPQDGLSNQIYFRKGYMGHVIIICQALVHACNNTVSHNLEQKGDDNDVTIKQTAAPFPSSPASLDNSSITFSFETTAIHSNSHYHDDEFGCSNSKKRKDRSPVRGGEDIKRLASSPFCNISEDSPTCHTLLESELSSSPPEVSQLPVDNESDSPRKPPLPINDILRQHPLFDEWQNFVTSVLASEMSVQSTPLGSQLATNKPNAAAVSSGINESFGSDFLDIDNDGPSPFQGSGLFGRLVVGEIDMDENDLDIAASMMEALRVGHNRHRPSFGGGGSILENETTGSEKISRGIANFGSVIQQPGGFHDYVYDDPLGQVHLFESADSNDEDDEIFNGTTSKNSFDDDGLLSDAMVVSCDGGVAKLYSRRNENITKSESSSSDEVYDDEDDDVPVLDLFAGSFDPSFADFDAMASDGNPFDPVEAKNGCLIGGDVGCKSDDDLFQFSNKTLLVDSLLSDPKD
jgi:hypothetical protein